MVAVGTMGMSTGVRQVAGQGIKETVKQGVLSGAKTGAVSGGITGASNYVIDAAFEKDVDFNPLKLIETTFKTAAGGAVVGGVLGGVGSAIKFNNAEKTFFRRKEQFPELSDEEILKLPEQAKNLKDGYTEIDQYGKEVKELAKGNKSVEKITARTKGEDSIFSKLANKFKNGKLTEVTDSNCYEAIGDAYGGRIQLKNLDCEKTRSFIEKYLESSEYTYDDVVEFLQSGKIGSNAQGCEELQEISKDIFMFFKRKTNSRNGRFFGCSN